MEPEARSDLSAESNHTRAKVLLAHTSWLLGMKGIREVGGIALGDKGYTQRFRGPASVQIEVAVTPSEPPKVEVGFLTQPVARYVVDPSGEENTTEMISVLSDRITTGIVQLASGFQDVEPIIGEDPQTTPGNELNLKTSDETRPKRKDVAPDTGDVAVHVKEKSSKKLRKRESDQDDREDGTGVPKLAPQVIAELASLWSRCSKMEQMEKELPALRRIIEAAKRGQPEQTRRLLREFDSRLVRRAQKGEARLVRRLRRSVIALERMLRITDDDRTVLRQPGERDSALARLRAVAKPESVLPHPYVGNLGGCASRNFIGARKRTPGGKVERLRRSGR